MPACPVRGVTCSLVETASQKLACYTCGSWWSDLLDSPSLNQWMKEYPLEENAHASSWAPNTGTIHEKHRSHSVSYFMCLLSYRLASRCRQTPRLWWKTSLHSHQQLVFWLDWSQRRVKCLSRRLHWASQPRCEESRRYEISREGRGDISFRDVWGLSGQTWASH